MASLHVHPADVGHASGDEGAGEHQDGPAPEGEPIRFTTKFPSHGRYGLFLQFKHEGKVRTAAFIQEVVR